ncbi:MAG: hypothetical protein OXH99_03435, partial [Bryobacterales bacterium]|nr:hypothetical protein [Bryobacterales bacterium]
MKTQELSLIMQAQLGIMTKRVWRDALGEAGLAAGLLAGPFGSVSAEVAAGDHAMALTLLRGRINLLGQGG